MPSLVRLGKIVVSMYGKPREHAPPHFHVSGPDVNFTVRLDNLQVLAGKADRDAFAAAVDWAKDKSGMLSAEWSKLND